MPPTNMLSLAADELRPLTTAEIDYVAGGGYGGYSRPSVNVAVAVAVGVGTAVGVAVAFNGKALASASNRLNVGAYA